MLLEAEVHVSLKAFLRKHHVTSWLHHLTMARLVARALRLGRSALIQTGTYVGRYCFSYLIPALLSPQPVLLVVPDSIRERLLEKEIPQLQKWLKNSKTVITSEEWCSCSDISPLILTSPQKWLADRLHNQGYFPKHIPTVIDQADYLESWTRQQLTLKITSRDWDELLEQSTSHRELITDIRVKITQNLFNRPKNPYDCYLLDNSIQDDLKNLCITLENQASLSDSFRRFWEQWQKQEQILWTSIERDTGKFYIYLAPSSVNRDLKQIWQEQPIVIMGEFLDREAYRNSVGLEDILCLNFTPDRQNELIQLYLPDRLPLPNTPEFQQALLQEIYKLINIANQVNQGVVILAEDVPLKAQIGTAIAAEFGSRVQVEKLDLAENGILVTGWEFWRQHQQELLQPQLLVMTTLPIPSLEHPVVASLVAYYKKKRQNWFRCYLLPTALTEIQKAILPLRMSQGVLAILDNRVNYRSYGNDILDALEPCARINYLNPLDLLPK